MGLTTQSMSIFAALVAGSEVEPTAIAVGNGSTAFTSGDTALDSETDRNYIDTYELVTAGQCTMVANWSPTDISGTILTEYGAFNSITAGIMINREVLAGSFVFDGESELQIQDTIRFTIA